MQTRHKRRLECGIVPMEVILTELTSPFFLVFRV